MRRHWPIVVALFGGLCLGIALDDHGTGRRTEAKEGPRVQDSEIAALKAEIQVLKDGVPDQAHAMQDVANQFTNVWFAEGKQHWDLANFYLGETRNHLRTLYASGLPPPLMRERKRETFEELREAYAALKLQWGGHAPFDAWFAADLNNAHLASIATYFTCVPGFERELKAVGGNLPAFYLRVRELAKLDQRQRDELVCATPQAR